MGEGCGLADTQFKSSNADPAVRLLIEPSTKPLPLQSISPSLVSTTTGAMKSLVIVRLALVPVQPLEPVLMILYVPDWFMMIPVVPVNVLSKLPFSNITAVPPFAFPVIMIAPVIQERVVPFVVSVGDRLIKFPLTITFALLLQPFTPVAVRVYVPVLLTKGLFIPLLNPFGPLRITLNHDADPESCTCAVPQLSCAGLPIVMTGSVLFSITRTVAEPLQNPLLAMNL